MITTVRSSDIARRLARNIIVTLAVTTIFAFKAAEPQAAIAGAEAVAIAAR